MQGRSLSPLSGRSKRRAGARLFEWLAGYSEADFRRAAGRDQVALRV